MFDDGFVVRNFDPDPPSYQGCYIPLGGGAKDAEVTVNAAGFKIVNANTMSSYLSL